MGKRLDERSKAILESMKYYGVHVFPDERALVAIKKALEGLERSEKIKPQPLNNEPRCEQCRLPQSECNCITDREV